MNQPTTAQNTPIEPTTQLFDAPQTSSESLQLNENLPINDTQDDAQNLSGEMQKAIDYGQKLTGQIEKALVGQKKVVHEVLTLLLAGGNVLIEGVPGLGKTLLVRILTQILGGTYKRIQFTADLMPADVSGHALFDFKSQSFIVRQGPIFCNFLLADEINRAPAKTQSALLEAMQEKQTTIDGKTYALPQPFMVLATQNPIEQDGTYPLPQAQLDRFMGKILIDYPSEDEEQALLARIANSQDGLTPDMQLNVLEQVLTLQELQDMQTQVAQVRCDQQILNYIVAIVRATRKHYGLDAGAGPRATMGLLQAARAHALLQGRAFVIPDDVKNCAPMVLRHRLRLSAELAIEGRKDDELVQEILEKIDAPRQ